MNGCWRPPLGQTNIYCTCQSLNAISFALRKPFLCFFFLFEQINGVGKQMGQQTRTINYIHFAVHLNMEAGRLFYHIFFTFAAKEIHSFHIVHFSFRLSTVFSLSLIICSECACVAFVFVAAKEQKMLKRTPGTIYFFVLYARRDASFDTLKNIYNFFPSNVAVFLSTSLNVSF